MQSKSFLTNKDSVIFLHYWILITVVIIIYDNLIHLVSTKKTACSKQTTIGTALYQKRLSEAQCPFNESLEQFGFQNEECC